MGAKLSVMCCRTQRSKVASVQKENSVSKEVVGRVVCLGLQIKRLDPPRSYSKALSSVDLYNILNSVSRFSPHLFDPYYILLLDLRSLESFNTQHIQGAFHCTSLSTSLISSKLQQFSRVILYDSTLASEKNSDAEKCIDILMNGQIDFELLEPGFDDFLSRFPSLCNNLVLWTVTQRKTLLTIYPSMVLENWLFQGDGDQATNTDILTALGITHIVNITLDIPCTIPKITYCHIKLQDEPKNNFKDSFDKVADFIDSAQRSDGKVLVHCNMGISRSTTAIIAYMMKYKQCSLSDAYRYVKHCRPVSSPNRGFLNQLSEYELYLFGKHFSDAYELWSKM